MSTSTLVPQLTVVEGRPVTTSLNIAEVFHKQHKNVIQAIQRLDIPDDFNQLNFQPVTYRDAKGEERPAYHITRDGFTLLAMGFTGKEAMKFKLAYIEAFNRMEAELIELATGSRDKKIDISHTHLRGTLAPGNLDIRYTMDLTKIVMRPNRTGIELLERLTGIPLTDVLDRAEEGPVANVERFVAEACASEQDAAVALAEFHTQYVLWLREKVDMASLAPSAKWLSATMRQLGWPVEKRGGVFRVLNLRLVEVRQ